MKGTIFDIKEFTVHDGPGSRITVFLKGCPLRCKWCHNPEGLSVEKQLLYKSTFCSHCGTCRKPCVHEECKPFGRCVYACPNGCLSIAGEEITSECLAERLLKNADILELMGGGITISGGEPMLQADFVCALAEQLGSVHKALQTSGYTDLATYQKVVSHMDYVMQDIKLADRNAHIKYTGVSNEKILRNIEWLKTSGKKFVFRVPLIPGITDTDENLQAIAEIAGDCYTELMPYNEFAGAKYSMVGMEYPLPVISQSVELKNISESNLVRNDTFLNRKRQKEDFTKSFHNAILLT